MHSPCYLDKKTLRCRRVGSVVFYSEWTHLSELVQSRPAVPELCYLREVPSHLKVPYPFMRKWLFSELPSSW